VVIVATHGSTFDMLPTVLNLTQLEFGIRKVVKRVLGLDAVVFPQSSDIEDVNKDRIGDAFGILCFHKKRTKEQMLGILEKAHSLEKLCRYFVWALWGQCDEVEWILGNLSEDLRGRVSDRYIAGDLQNQPRAFIVALDDRVKDVEKGDSQILAEVQSALENPDFGEVQVQISEKYKLRGARIIQFLELCGYKIEQLGKSASSVGYQVHRQRPISNTKPHKKLPPNKGRSALMLGLRVQSQIIRQFQSSGAKIAYSWLRGHPDIIVFDNNDKPFEVVAVKSFTLELTTGKGCRNTKGHKYVAAVKPSRDAKAEVAAAKKYGLNKIRLIVINLKTGNRIFDKLVRFDEKITLREYR
jgi:hypothetical protein